MPQDWPEITRTYALLGQISLADLRGIANPFELHGAIVACWDAGQPAVYKAQRYGFGSYSDIVHFATPWQFPGQEGPVVMPPEEPWYVAGCGGSQFLPVCPVDLPEDAVGFVIEHVLVAQDMRTQLKDVAFVSLSGAVRYSDGHMEVI